MYVLFCIEEGSDTFDERNNKFCLFIPYVFVVLHCRATLLFHYYWRPMRKVVQPKNKIVPLGGSRANFWFKF